MTLNATPGLVGTSILEVARAFVLGRGDDHDIAAGMRADFGAWALLPLDIANVLDSRANRFSYGNSFFVA